MKTSGSNVENGKAFEYALAKEYAVYLRSLDLRVEIVKDRNEEIARTYYETFSEDKKHMYDLSARASIPTMLKLEPGLTAQRDLKDILYISLASDMEGVDGDVRDVVFSRPLSDWEIGFSAKNNNDAVKHSRLSMSIDFGDKWLGYNVSSDYWSQVTPIFNKLVEYKNQGLEWSSLGGHKFKEYYVPLLRAFMEEIKRLDKNYSFVPERLVQYLIGNKPFYKIIKDDADSVIIVKSFNIGGGLGKTVNGKKPKFRTKMIEYPSRIVEVDFFNKGEGKSDNTVDMIMDGGWEVSFRLHNASSKVEPSLKFDVRLLGNPPILFTQYIFQENQIL